MTHTTPRCARRCWRGTRANKPSPGKTPRRSKGAACRLRISQRAWLTSFWLTPCAPPSRRSAGTCQRRRLRRPPVVGEGRPGGCRGSRKARHIRLLALDSDRGRCRLAPGHVEFREIPASVKKGSGVAAASWSHGVKADRTGASNGLPVRRNPPRRKQHTYYLTLTLTA